MAEMLETPPCPRRIKLTPGDYCLHAVFTKDLSYKYGRYWGKDDKATRRHPEEGEWCVAGTFDYLRFVRFDSLEGVINQEADWARQVPWEDSWRLMLFPLADPAPDESLLSGLLNPTFDEHPLLVLTRITLSPVAYELEAHDGRPDEKTRLGSVLRAVANLVSLLEHAGTQNPGLPPIAYFGSLSGPDLVMVALAQRPAQLHALHAFARLTRSLRLAELKMGRFWSEPLVESQADTAKNFPGHACAMVTPTLAFQLGAGNSSFEDQSFREEEKRHGLRLDFSLRVDCGHESQVVGDILKTCRRLDGTSDVDFEQCDVAPPAEQPWGKIGTDDESASSPDKAPRRPVVAIWNTHLVRGRFHHLGAFAKTWKKLWFNDIGPNSWRSLNLLDSVTVFSMNDDVAGWEQVSTNWVIDGSVRSALETIEQSLNAFSARFLNPIQRNELRSLFNSFHSYFFRQDLLGTSRDLFPFFSQLGRTMEDISQWERYFGMAQGQGGRDQPVADNESNDDGDEKSTLTDRWSEFQLHLQDLITHMNRALRNRVEHRSTIGDPPFPQTLRTGACKIINAYTFVVHLCFELLHRSNRDPRAHRDFCEVSRFAVCAHAGTQGKVEIEELFKDYRESVMSSENPAKQPQSLSQRVDAHSLAPLFLLEVPPQSLLRPELAILHCLHEVAELSGWIMLERCDALRELLNGWLLNEAVTVFQWRLAEQSCRDPRRQDDPQRAEIEEALPHFATFARNFIPYCLAMHDAVLEEGNESGDAVLAHAAKLRQNQHPTDLAEKLICAICEVGSVRENLASFATLMEHSIRSGDKLLRPWGAQCCPEIATDPLFTRQLEILRDLATELIGDIGMWCSLHALLNPQGGKISQEQCFEHLVKTFRSIFAVAAEAAPSYDTNKRLEQTILHRFAVQATAVLPASEDVKARILERFDDLASGLSRDEFCKCLKHSLDRKPQFDQNEGLVAALRQFAPYGGSNDLEFLSFPVGDEADQVVQAFRKAWNETGRLNARLNLLLVLWGASNRFAIPRLLTNRNLT